MTGRILIVRLGSLGDLVHTLPAASALRRAHPQAELDWLVDAPHRAFLELVPVISSVIVLAERGPRGWLNARRTLRARRYDVAIDFQGLVKSAALARLSGARRVIGFDRQALREPLAAPFYSQRADVGEGSHVIHKNLRLAGALGAAPAPIEFPIGPVEAPAISAFAAADSRPFAILNPGAAWPNKQWPPDRLGAVAGWLLSETGMASVVVWGPGEQEAASHVVRSSRGAARLAPATGLQEFIALARRARLMVSGDTGPLHIACALDVPAVALFGPTDPARNGPWNPDDVVISRYATCDCHYQRRCRRTPDEWCLGGIAVSEVIDAVQERLRRRTQAVSGR